MVAPFVTGGSRIVRFRGIGDSAVEILLREGILTETNPGRSHNRPFRLTGACFRFVPFRVFAGVCMYLTASRPRFDVTS